MASNVQEEDEEISEKADPSRRREKSGGSSIGKGTSASNAAATTDKEKKIGHRRVDDTGQVSYKKIHVNQLMQSIQLGIQNSIGAMSRYDERDLLMQDFMTVETVSFPKQGSQQTPAHPFSDFTFRTVAPLAFRYFLNLFGIRREDFMMSLCNEAMRELSNPGASGSIFYLTNDDEFILKTVQHKEAEFLQKLLPGYYMNLNQNPHTLLPKFFGMYCYQCNQKNIRLTVMNNLLPSKVKMHLKFDLKGSTYKRKASKHEKAKKSPTYKDLDFIDIFPEGVLLEPETYNALITTLRRDCRVLESFKIMDYSLLVGIHNLDQAAKEDAEGNGSPGNSAKKNRHPAQILDKQVSQQKKLVAHSTAMESIQAQVEPIDEQEHLPPGGIPARNHKGERLLLYLGIIDILQSYRMFKKLEHTLKSIIHDGDTVSVHNPSFYAHRFLDFMADKVFKKIPSLDLPEIKGSHRKFRTTVLTMIGVGHHYNSALKHSPSRKSKRESMKKMSTSSTAGGAEASTSQQAEASSSKVHQDPAATLKADDVIAYADGSKRPAEGEEEVEVNLPPVLWDKPTTANRSRVPVTARAVPTGPRSPTADACNAVIAAAFSPNHQKNPTPSSSSSTTTTTSSSNRTVVARGAELTYNQHSSSQPDINHGHGDKFRARNRLHENLKQNSSSDRVDRRTDSRSSLDTGEQHHTPSRISLGGGSMTPTWTEGTPSLTESTNSAADLSSRPATGNTPSRSLGEATSRDSVLTRNYKDTFYHETEI